MTTATVTTARVSPRALHLLLAFANFAVGIGAFVVVGVLSPVAAAFGIGKAEAGWLMTIYAVVYALTSPILVAITGGVDRARLLIAGLVLLVSGAALAALAPGYEMLLAARALMAIGSGLVTPVAAAIGVASVGPEHRGTALATVFSGFTLAQALGVPIGAWLGYALGWRAAFGVVTVLALTAAVVLYRLAPRGLVVPHTSLATLGAVLRTPHLVLALAFTALVLGSAFVFYTYLAPFLEARHGLERTGVSFVLLVFGLGAVIGNAMGGYLTDRIGPVPTLAALCLMQAALLPLLTLLHLPLPATVAVVAAWSISGWSVHVPQQARLAALDPPRAPVLFALHAAAIYVGSSIGSLIGGQSLRLAGHDALGPVGATLALLALLSLAAVGGFPLPRRVKPSHHAAPAPGQRG